MFDSLEKKSEYLKDISVIIRSCNERTEDLCMFSIEQNHIPNHQINIIKNIHPFSEALRKSYEIGIKMNKKYTLCVDADYILKKNSILLILNIAENLPNKVFFINSLWYDYITETISPGGPHLYRTELLPKAIKYIPNEKKSIRPETFTTKKMNENGFSSIYLDIPTTLHGFEQYRKDIFRNVVNKYFKSRREIDKIEKKIKNNSAQDKDLEVILKAIQYCKENKINLKLDYRQFEYEFEKIKIKDKDPISKKDIPKKYDDLIMKIKEIEKVYQVKGYTYNLLNKNSEKFITRLAEKLYLNNFIFSKK